MTHHVASGHTTHNKAGTKITDILRQHIVTIAGILSQLFMIEHITIMRLTVLLFTPIANIAMDLWDYVSSRTKENMKVDRSSIPSDYSITDIMAVKPYGEYNNRVFTDVATYINEEIIRKNKNLMVGTKYNIDSVNIFNNKPLLSLAENQQVQFEYTDNVTRTTSIIYISHTMNTIDKPNSTGKTHEYIYTIYAPTQPIINHFLDTCATYYDDLQTNSSNYAMYRYTGNSKNTWEPYNISLKKTFKNMFLSHYMDSFLPSMIRNFYKHTGQYNLDYTGQTNKIALLLYGRPGCGKSSLAYAIANEFKKNIYRLDPQLLSTNTFYKCIREIKDSIIVIEEIDTISLFWKRQENSVNDIDDDKYTPCQDTNTQQTTPPINDASTDENNSNKAHSLIKQYTERDRLERMNIMLDILDAYCYLNGCIVIATTNYPDKIDPAFFRSGRFDHKLEFKPADDYQIRNIYAYFYKEWYVPEKVIQHMLDNEVTTSYIINTLIQPCISSGPESTFNAYKRDYPGFDFDWLTDSSVDAYDTDSYYSTDSDYSIVA